MAIINTAIAVDSFMQLEEDIKSKYPVVDYFFYNEHMGIWEVQFTDHVREEADDFFEMIQLIERKQA